MSAPWLETRALDVAIAGKRVCAGLDLAIAGGERWAVLGVNGVGKTTLLRTLAGLRAPAAGEVRIDGAPIGAYRRRELARRRGMLFQAEHDTFETSVLDAVLAGRHPHVPPWGWEGRADLAAARVALERVALAGFEARAAGSLSGGERRRVSLATLLAQDPPLMLLDEPTSHLDLHHQVATLAMLAGIGTAKAIVMTLHDVNLAARFCTHAALLLGDGEVRLGSVEEVLEPALLTRLYRHPVERVPGPRGALFVPG